MTASERIVLHEHEEWRGALDPDDAEFIASGLSGKFAIRREVRGQGYVINPRQFVGVVALPSGVTLEVRPKAPIASVFQMLVVSYQVPVTFYDEVVGLTSFDDVVHVVARYFADLVEDRLRRGLYRTYAETEDNLLTVRGRILFAEDVRHNYALRHRTYCKFSEFTWDVPENQVIRQVVQLLRGFRFPTSLISRLAEIDAAMAEVTPSRLVSDDVALITYTRFNADYQPIHQLCQLFLDGMSLTNDLGPASMRAFLVDMNRLFETFVTCLLGKQLSREYALVAQGRMFLGRERRIEMRPDIVITRRGRPVLVADCKYKLTNVDEFDNHDYYQMLAYCTASGVTEGLLIVPKHEEASDADIRIRGIDVTIRRRTVNLAGSDGLEAVGNELRRFMEEMLQITRA